ncbi:MAG: glycosyltransferase family 2 protein [Pseudomonadota bacterium]
MKLVIQIPCLNEEESLAKTLQDLPTSLGGIDEIQILVIDDGSTDDTVAVARAHGVDKIVHHSRNRGLAKSFQSGLEAALAMGADLIVNTDADNQYCGEDIALLVKPLLAGEADIVIGDRQLAKNRQFGAVKTMLQKLGSSVVSSLSGLRVPDAVSGFRALTRAAALQTTIISNFSYTTEMIIQAGNKRMAVTSVPIRTNRVTRPPRLFKSTPSFVLQQGITMIRMYAMYRPLRFFFIIGAILSMIGIVPMLRFLYFFFNGDGTGHLQSLVLGSAILILGMMVFVTGLLSDLISQNRRLQEDILERIRRSEQLNACSENQKLADRPALQKTSAPG